jgi:hypothetical protein
MLTVWLGVLSMSAALILSTCGAVWGEAGGGATPGGRREEDARARISAPAFPCWLAGYAEFPPLISSLTSPPHLHFSVGTLTCFLSR